MMRKKALVMVVYLLQSSEVRIQIFNRLSLANAYGYLAWKDIYQVAEPEVSSRE